MKIMRRLTCSIAFALIMSAFLQSAIATEDSAQEIAALEFPTIALGIAQGPLHFHTNYDEHNAKVLANIINTLILGTYKKNNHITPLPGYQLVKPLYLNEEGVTSLFGAIYESNDKSNMIIAFRGTQTQYEWKMDLMEDLVSFYGSDKLKVNDGDYKVYQQLQNEIFKTIKQSSSLKHLWITGHSLGGAVATITAADAIRQLDSTPTLSTYTFGSPRVVNHNLAEYIRHSRVNLFRIINVADVVPSVPYSAVRHAAYEHVGNPIIYQANYENAAENHAYYLKDFVNKPSEVLNVQSPTLRQCLTLQQIQSVHFTHYTRYPLRDEEERKAFQADTTKSFGINGHTQNWRITLKPVHIKGPLKTPGDETSNPLKRADFLLTKLSPQSAQSQNSSSGTLECLYIEDAASNTVVTALKLDHREKKDQS